MNIDEIPVGKANDLTGKVFNKLTVLYRTKNQGKKVVWHCKCECGNECDVMACHLTDGSIKSCGCLRSENVTNFHDLTGQKFGKLTALYPVNLGSGEKLKWHCRCDCGNECDVMSCHLVSGSSKSCGCIKSYGEEKIASLLTKNRIPFQTQKTFSDCIFPDTKYKAFFDFYVDNTYLIEFDGEQHFKENGGWNTSEHFKSTQQHDLFKNTWCEKNNIPLIRIPYTSLSSLSIEDLLLTSQFLL